MPGCITAGVGKYQPISASAAAWRGTEEDADTETVDVEKCGLCDGDSFKNDVFRDTVIRLIAQVTARNVKRD